jgi:hypothetical protein
LLPGYAVSGKTVYGSRKNVLFNDEMENNGCKVALPTFKEDDFHQLGGRVK